MTPLWTSDEASAATGGRATRAFSATGVSIDSRTLRPGDLFVALKDQRDGHAFVAQALANGAAAALVSRIPDGLTDGAPLLLVPDVLEALAALGRVARARSRARVIGVTGSVGKTSTKEMLRAALRGQGTVHAAEASYNNHWGVPLTLARMPADVDFAVIEIGMNHPGEIAPLARLARPHLALITTVAPAHLEAFDSITAIAEEKAAILEGLEPGGLAILPADLEVTPVLAARALALGVPAMTFGQSGAADWRLSDIQITPEATIARASHADQTFLFKVLTPGRHFAANALAVLAAAEALGLDLTITACDLGLWSPPAGRGTRERIALDPVDGAGFDLIDDAFNANPASVAASLELLAAMAPTDGVGRISTGRRIAILGDMLELGPTEAALHRAIADHPALAGIALVHCVGPRMRALHEALPRRQRGEWVETAAELVPRARLLVDAGDIVLVKGSKGIKVSLVVDALRKLGQSGPSRTRGAE
ncbi:UDP-N-acetylmuramoyl-tripeptide--D-alanyl-D-alanine ligase [Cereibacter azotoformans]|uniref:UDP-N-acetylmuramoyl-tripeptide--D-alanyl-D-alanine ligase n=1 Tax=Cereibacter azotoformans TaxID=43057 RepID=A0A2T5K6U6_9RHOB|nr:UDP-N-acetylmuramoyl-tripeptide--D-alanyl-D-alanine ligase [Cereibacter azotoformans]AXQ92906.1 UDP-N-acetylmuramoyl-tripeptide--D-alanyl-D-alanine ligase [Cereibacter sphaeroides]MBO4169422.1 UDP-N-acetylmuramoyl-tripeptide--D-alanyl-D-alanine ligase [Cereibacter azotoformans]PTR18099.1 UDP-N-acetylmuramoyl-tripeptide--D-alanyl-D-alanine ligase [Cereibacter azotoformans]UIJ31194.1 UDP-N-acetylmuramoyl-tripeptide--D-alanyl-D-alanine ligase [Cereibacter azotoformans]